MNGKKLLRTPLIKPRKQSGTFYTFGSALEDIGLNINELNNKVVLSHYVLLDLPNFDSSTLMTSSNYADSSNAGDMIFAEGFQNYVLNMEATVRNHVKYDFTNSITVSERIFWKWLKPFMHMDASSSNDVTRYIDSSSIAKCFGYINSGAQRSDDYSMYNETFVQVPSSFCQMRVLYKVTEDDNYYADSSYVSSSSVGYIENINEDEITDGVLNKTGISAMGIFDDREQFAYNVNEETDLFTIDFSLDSLRKFYGNEHITYDDLAIHSINDNDEENYTLGDNFEFNAALIYYSIYDSTGKNILATNAYGLLLFNNTEEVEGENGTEYRFEPFVKKASTPTMSGTSYSFRLNIKASSVYSGDIEVSDNSTPAYAMATDFNDTVKNLYTAINILRSNANLIAVISSDYRNLKNLTIEAIEKADQAEKEVSELKNGRFKVLDSSNFHTNNIVVSDGIHIMEGGGFRNEESGVTFTINSVKSSSVKASDVSTNILSMNTVEIPDNGIVFTDGESQEKIIEISKEGLSSKNITIDQDNLPEGITTVNDTIIDQVFENIDARRDPSTGNMWIYIERGAQGEAGDIIDKICDAETGKLNLKQLLAIIIAKIKYS